MPVLSLLFAATLALPPPTLRGLHCEGLLAPERPLLIVAGGWRARPEWVWAWGRALQPRLQGSQLCVIRGPEQVLFQRRDDIDVQGLAQWLAPHRAGIHLIAHSSGSFVAHALLRELPEAQRGRSHYVNLDGAIGSGDLELDTGRIAQLASVTAVYARATEGDESANAATMRELAARDPRVRLIALDAADSGCAPKARWCLHQVPVIRRPHDPQRYDLERDYQGFGPGRAVQTDYLPR